MAIELIGKIKQKNNGTFALVDSQDIDHEGQRLNVVLQELENGGTAVTALTQRVEANEGKITALQGEVTCYVSSESNYDFGGVYVGSKIYKPTQSQAKNGTTDSAGSYLIRQSGSNSSKEYTMTLTANTTYYLNFFYVKDGSNNSNSDRFFVSKIQYRAVV